MLSIGVEEEYLLTDAATGVPAARAEQVREAAGLQPALNGGEVQRELLQAQIEVATPVCHDLAELGGHLLRLRTGLGAAAAAAGCRLAASGTAPFPDRVLVPVSRIRRYRAMRADARLLTDEQLIAGMHVHIGIPDRRTGVHVLNGLRPALPMLVALSANSPMWHGIDTGFASWRTLVFDRWPVSGLPPRFAGPADYRQRTEELVRSGMIRDLGQIYWMVRLSARYPTVEVRAMDVQLRVDEAVLLAGLIRLLTEALIDGRPLGPPDTAGRPEMLRAAVWHAARYGADGAFTDPLTGRSGRAHTAARALLERIAPADGTDPALIDRLLHRTGCEGNGAVRQRRAVRRGGRACLLDLIEEETACA